MSKNSTTKVITCSLQTDKSEFCPTDGSYVDRRIPILVRTFDVKYSCIAKEIHIFLMLNPINLISNLAINRIT